MTTSIAAPNLSALRIQAQKSEHDRDGPMIRSRFAVAFDAADVIATYADNVQYNKVQTRDLVRALFEGLKRVVNIWRVRTSGEGNLNLNLNFVSTLKDYLRIFNEIEEALSRHAGQGFLRRRLNRSENLEELKQLEVGLSEALSNFLITSELIAQNQDENVQQSSSTLVIDSSEDMSDIFAPVWAAAWNSRLSPQGCLSGTRADVIERISSWALEPKSDLSVFWLSGLAGTGKSAIAKSVCEQIAKRGNTVLVTFFASKSSRERSDPFRMLQSFLHQLADADATFLQHLRSNLPTDKDISQWTFPEQVDRLLKASFDAAYTSRETVPLIVLVIDALDEFNMVNDIDGQDLITHLISPLRGLPLKLILASRPEPHLMDTFRTLDLDKSVLELHGIPEAMFSHDIRSIYARGFADIALSRRIMGLWPSEHALSELVRRTGNLPVLASSVLKYVGDTGYSPKARLQLVLESASFNTSSEDSPFMQVDLMYMEVLLRAVADQDEAINLDRCRKLHRMLRAIVAVYPHDIGIHQLALLLRASELGIQPELNTLSSVLLMSTHENGHTMTKIFHQSFRDFLVHRCTDEHFLIGEDHPIQDTELLEDIRLFMNNRAGSGSHHPTDTQLSSNYSEAVRSSLPEHSDTSSSHNISSTVSSLAEMTADQLQMWLDDNREHDLRPIAVRRLVELASQEDRIIPTGLLIRGVKQIDSEPVGRGAFADVFKGVYQEEDVAIKRLFMKRGDASKLMKRFYREAVIWRQLRHAQILSFLGVDGDALLKNANSVGMVSPWMTQGTLLEYLSQPLPSSTSRHRDLIVNVAAGLGYLHAQPFVHGDLHDSNIFINDRHQAILGDFGLTRIDDSPDVAPTTTTGSNNAGAVRWLSPELLYGDENAPMRKTKSGDIFAFGRVCLAVYTRNLPWRNITSDVHILMKVLNHELPSRPSAADCHGATMPDDLWDLMVRCWYKDHEDRPNIEQVISTLRIIDFGMT